MNKYKTWSAEEVNKLIELRYEGKTPSMMLNHFPNKTLPQIQNKIDKILDKAKSTKNNKKPEMTFSETIHTPLTGDVFVQAINILKAARVYNCKDRLHYINEKVVAAQNIIREANARLKSNGLPQIGNIALQV